MVLLLLVGCENTKHKIGLSTKPFQSGEDLKDNTTVKLHHSFRQGTPTGGRLIMIWGYKTTNHCSHRIFILYTLFGVYLNGTR